MLLPLPASPAGFTWREALPGYAYQFPRDHFEHQDFRTEWWYYTGNVTGAAGERYGFELVFFRQGENRAAQSKSAWAVQDVYLAHAALTDARGKKFWYEERLNRAGPGVAGASFEQRRIWNGNWQVAWNGEVQTLDAVTDHFKFHLQLLPKNPLVIHGENGVSQKGEGEGRASHYVSFPLLAVAGTIDGKAVTGRAWMDHEWFTEQLAPDQVGWDWFSIQLDNNTELMLFELRRKDGSIDPHSSGTFIDEKGRERHLTRQDFSLQPVSYWHKYPVQWKIQVPSEHIDIVSHAVLPDQELKNPSYWEGAVDYTGTRSGAGYIEMTGYDGPVKFQ
ncbi:MAG TPA: lipocalin-like domain-containing protein [Bryobacteraceae bacterium]|nr:lipocalin-like domain-containing protein [Bryobacteraceae bacterium]